MNKHEYTMWVTIENSKFPRIVASFTEGEPSRFGIPLTEKLMRMEAIDYQFHYKGREVLVIRDDGKVVFM